MIIAASFIGVFSLSCIFGLILARILHVPMSNRERVLSDAEQIEYLRRYHRARSERKLP